MAKASIILMFFTLLLATQITGNSGRKTESGPDAEAKALFRSMRRGNEKLARIRLYIQETLSGPNATLYEVARASITANSSTSFGQVRVIDDLVTAGPERNSTVLGRSQGIIAASDLEAQALTMTLVYLFTSGEYNGSTICIQGRNQFMDQQREVPVVGGTGVFRFSRGYDVSSITAFDTAAPGYVTVEHTIYATYVDTRSDVS